MTALDERLRAALAPLVADLVRAEVKRQVADATRPAEYISLTEAGRIASVTPRTLRRWIAEGKLTKHPAGRHVRVRRADLDALLRGDGPDRGLSPEELAARDFGH